MIAVLIHLCDVAIVAGLAAAAWFASGIVSGRYDGAQAPRRSAR